MNIIHFRRLVELLPRGDNVIPKKLPAGFSLVKAANPCFVEPELIEQKSIELGRTSVVLLAAPGAVGKSTLAAELAVRTASPLWDLSKVQVGSRTFSGTILEAYDFQATGALKRFQEGRALFVLDAMDEAQVRAGTQNFDAFLTDLADSLKTHREKPALVVLARVDTADWVNLVFDDAHVPLARYQIAYCDRASAEEFIDKRLDAYRAKDGKQSVHRFQQQPYAEARKEILHLVYRLFSVDPATAWSDTRVRDFLGYAPVLEALTDYLDVSNYQLVTQELREEVGAVRDAWQFLTDIMTRLLAREKSKLIEAVRPQLETLADKAEWSAWDALYESGEQCERVLNHTLRKAASHIDIKLPPSLVTPYEDALMTQLPQHPFLAGRLFANVVFREYIYAWGLTCGNSSLAATLREAMRKREDPFLPSELFSWFVVNIRGNGVAVLDGQDFGVFYESLLSRTQKVPLNIIQNADSIQASLEVSGGDHGDFRIDLLDTGMGLHFWRKLNHAEIDVRSSVRIGLTEQRFIIGPEVYVMCGELCVDSGVVDVDVIENVTIQATSYSASAADLRLNIRNEGKGLLAVTWPSVGYPWAPYRSRVREGKGNLQDTVRGDALRKFILMFRKQRSRLSSTVKTTRWAPEQLVDRGELIELALKTGVLLEIRGHEAFELNSEYDSLRTIVTERPQLSAKARDFVIAFLGRQEAERVLDT